MYVFSCARVSVWMFCICGVILGGGPPSARHLKLGDATPIVQSRPARKGNKQTQTDKRTNITQKRNAVDSSSPFVSWPGQTVHTGGQSVQGQLGGSAKPSTPCSPCTLKKSLHMTNQPHIRNNSSIARVRHVFRCSVCLYIYIYMYIYIYIISLRWCG